MMLVMPNVIINHETTTIVNALINAFSEVLILMDALVEITVLQRLKIFQHRHHTVYTITCF